MIDKYSLTPDWLFEKRQQYEKADPAIMERVIFALYLLEELSKTQLKFVFKGGTSLLLLMETPARFSIDIDIVVPSETAREALENELAKIPANSNFTRMVLDERRSYHPGIPKAHYKFIYNSFAIGKEQEILLDILFEETHYPLIVNRPILCEWIKTDIPDQLVATPDINSITGDKLTAFAPSTIGVPFKKEKEREIIKQLYDVGSLFELTTDIEIIKKAFTAMALNEISYRQDVPLTVDDVLDDIIQTGLILANRDKQSTAANNEKYKELTVGINQFKYFLYRGNFRIEEAQVASAKAAYLAALIKTNAADPPLRFDKEVPLKSYIIDHPNFNYLNKKIKNVPGGALFYWYQTITLLYPE